MNPVTPWSPLTGSHVDMMRNAIDSLNAVMGERMMIFNTDNPFDAIPAHPMPWGVRRAVLNIVTSSLLEGHMEHHCTQKLSVLMVVGWLNTTWPVEPTESDHAWATVFLNLLLNGIDMTDLCNLPETSERP